MTFFPTSMQTILHKLNLFQYPISGSKRYVNKNHLVDRDGKSQSRWLNPKEGILAELTQQFKEDGIQAWLDLEVRDVIGALVIYFSMKSLALLFFIDQCHFQAVSLQDGEMAERS